MNVFHCNKCARKLITSLLPIPNIDGNVESLPTYLTNCAHIYCSLCKIHSEGHCFLCREKCSFVGIDHNAPPEIRHLFEQTIDAYRKFRETHKFQIKQADIKREMITKMIKYYRHKYNEELINYQKCKKRLIYANVIASRSAALNEAFDKFIR